MNSESRIDLDPRAQRAVDELRDIIANRYPSTTFVVSRGEDEPQNIHLIATVDVDDGDEILNLVMDRLLEMQVNDRIPVHVIPVRVPERIQASGAEQASNRRRRVVRQMPLLSPRPITPR